MSARVDLSTKREREIPGNTAQPSSAPSAIDSLRYPEMSPDAKGWLVRIVNKNYLSQDEWNQLDPKQKEVYNQFLALDKAVSDFIDIASTVAFKERIGRRPADWQARISHANSVVQAKLLELWQGLVDLPENIQTALTDKQTRSAPGDWNNPYWGSNEFVSVSTSQQVFFKKYESSYRFKPKDTIYDQSLSGQDKNPLHSAIAYIQNLQERVKEVADAPFDNAPRGDLPPASKLRDSLREMIFDYVLQARNQQSTLASSPK